MEMLFEVATRPTQVNFAVVKGGRVRERLFERHRLDHDAVIE